MEIVIVIAIVIIGLRIIAAVGSISGKNREGGGGLFNAIKEGYFLIISIYFYRACVCMYYHGGIVNSVHGVSVFVHGVANFCERVPMIF